MLPIGTIVLSLELFSVFCVLSQCLHMEPQCLLVCYFMAISRQSGGVTLLSL